ncbi:MAG: DNA mismatch repair endonuclease MutL [Verrucomicrobia bacterium]|nr:DNA mismatch repair endonuclease MutL [Verrucomicrobiota bacterium]
MSRIRLLPEQVANQIAAGEVVERPASVVKELVENALDAGAHHISVEIQAGGRSLIRVTDDGWGMNKDDALLSLERHATSKIRVAEDLDAVQSFGFRGEALPSIASVSRFTLTTKERESNAPEGTQIVVQGGKIVEVRSAASPTGSAVEVRQLFFNLPARRKFLRSEETERTHIAHYLTLAALAHPEVAFTFLQDQRLVWRLPPLPRHENGDRFPGLRERLRSLLGGDVQLVRVEFERPLPPRFTSPTLQEDAGETLHEPVPATNPGVLRLWGYIGAPGVSRATREDQHLFVNKRPVEHRGLNFALAEGYHTALMKGRFPVCCLFLEVPPGEVDVNVHPAKREVRFHQEALVRRMVSDAVRNTLLNFHLHSTSGTHTRSAPDSPPLPAPPPTHPQASIPPAPTSPHPIHPADRTTLSAGNTNPPEHVADPADSTVETAAPPKRSISSRDGADPPTAPVTATLFPAAPLDSPAARTHTSPPSPPPVPGPQSSNPPWVNPDRAPLLSVPLRVVGVVGRLYVVLESDRGLVLLDQHAAHERVLFEQMMRRLEHGPAPSQRLLLAETVELSSRDAVFLREQLPTLNRLGVGLSEFGERTFLLDALPPMTKTSDARRFVHALIDQLKQAGENVNSMRLGEDVVAKTVCRHAVKANDPLQGPELLRLVEDLKRCSMPYTCPHGRPTLIEMNYRELERKFGRST